MIAQVLPDPGFVIAPHVFSEKECDEVLDTLTHASGQRSRAGIRHLMDNQDVRGFANDRRLITLASPWLGATPIPFRATLFDKSARTNWLVPWHQDTALPLVDTFDATGWGPWSKKAGVNYAHAPGWALERVIALRIHLDASTSHNGPLRLIPGSHLDGVLTDAAVLQCASASEHRAVECLTPRGGVVAMRPLIIHSSSKALNTHSRRVLHIEYADSLDFAPGIRLAVS